MLSSVEQAFVGREEIRAPLKTPAWEASYYQATFMVIEVVKEDCNFAAKALLTISMVITFARGGRNPGRNPLHGDPLIL